MEDIIGEYFKKNYTHNTILQLLEKYHAIKISRSTLLNKLKEYGLQRRGNTIDRDHVRRCILEELDRSTVNRNGMVRLAGKLQRDRKYMLETTFYFDT